jgi:alcohol dehydrogenase (cytochrome c)
VIVGPAGGEYGIRGFIAAHDAKTGKEVWRFNTIPGPGEPGHDTWQGDDWKSGGAPVWVTGSYDPELNLTYWGIGNPGPDWNPNQRPGDNLYSNSVVALDPDTGQLKWHFQFTPNDAYDFDATQVPVLADIEWQGRPLKAMLWANRNGYFYVLDRSNGTFLAGEPFVKVNWSSGLDQKGRPIPTPQPDGMPTWPGHGGTNWYPPSFSPSTGLFYVSVWENYAAIFRKQEQDYVAGRSFYGGSTTMLKPTPGMPVIGLDRNGPINTWTSEVASGATIAIDPKSGQRVWTFAQFDVTDAGVLTTASDLLFTGGREGYFYALDARTGKELWKASLGGSIAMAPITYQVDGKQYLSVISGNMLVTFGLRN